MTALRKTTSLFPTGEENPGFGTVFTTGFPNSTTEDVSSYYEPNKKTGISNKTKTDSSFSKGCFVNFKEQTATKKQVDQLGKGIKNKAKGTVLFVEDQFIECEIDAGSEQLQIKLPKVYFPENVKCNMPFYLEMSTSGFCHPIITERIILKSDRIGINESLKAFVDDL